MTNQEAGGFLYFIPGETRQLDPRSCGLGYLGRHKDVILADVRFSQGDYSAEGVLCGVKRNTTASRFGFHNNDQTWRKIPKSDIWIGYWNKAKPTPYTLSRDALLDGYSHTFEDGNDWVCPCARRVAEDDSGDIAGYITLPKGVSLGEDGEWTSAGVKKQFRELWELALEYFAIWASSEVTFRFEKRPRLAVLALQANYLISDIEIDILGIFDDEAMDAILSALIDEPGYLEIVKKKHQEAPSTLGDSSGPIGMPVAQEE